jgi:acetate kinase
VAGDGGRVLVLNGGSSSVKLALVDPSTGERALTALGDKVGSTDAVVRWRRGDEESSTTPSDTSPAGVVEHLLGELSDEERSSVIAVGHRVVHGGQRFTESVVVDDSVMTGLAEITDLAPLHLPANREGVEAARRVLPDVPHVLVFDTAFHRTLPPVAYRYAVPTAWYEEHDVRRYGFHGTSHYYVSRRAAELLGRPVESLRLVTLHLGNGCSAAAVRGGGSVDTTMGLTPLEGLVMGSRSGDVDPALLGYVAKKLDLDVDGVLDVLNSESGLLGLSGSSNDMRTLVAEAADGSETAQLAFDVFCYRAAKAVGALAVALDGLDAVVFTGGIGEKAVEVRAAVLGRLGVLKLAVDDDANARHGEGTDGRVSAGTSPVALVVPTDEELVIARETERLTG